MKFLNLRTMALSALALSTVYTSAALAETTTLNVNANVQNAITIVETTPMDFGDLVALNEAGNQAYIAIDTNDTLSAPVSAGTALITPTGGTPASGVVTVTAANGATVNMTIATPVNPANGGDNMVLSNVVIRVPGAGSSTAITGGGAAITYVADGTAQDVIFGARLSTPATATQIADGAYAGTIAVTAAY